MTRREQELDVLNPYSFMGLLASQGKIPGAVSAPMNADVNRRRFRRK